MTSSTSFDWHYAGLSEIRTCHTPYGREVKLLCHDDEGAGFFSVRCPASQLRHLAPYAALLAEAQDGGAEPPAVPIQSQGGSSTFSVLGAEYDYPELSVYRGVLPVLRQDPPPRIGCAFRQPKQVDTSTRPH